MPNILLEQAIAEIVGAAACVDISKASLQVSRYQRSPLCLEVLKLGDVFEAQVNNSQEAASRSALQLVSDLVAICEAELGDDVPAHAVLRAESPSSFVPASVARLVDGKVLFQQLNAVQLKLIDTGVDLALEKIASGEIDSARLLLNDGKKFWTICFTQNLAYSNDFDLFAAAPPSFHCENAALESRKKSVMSFLSECFAGSEYIQARLQMDAAGGRASEQLVADSRKGSDFGEPEVFDPPV
jgi:hypothetical protein